MSNPALDNQIKIALRDDETAEKFAEHIAELAAQIVNATFKFSQDVKSAYESIPKRRLGDKNFDEIDQAKSCERIKARASSSTARLTTFKQGCAARVIRPFGLASLAGLVRLAELIQIKV